MRNLKRALSLALALVMVLSMMVVGAGAVSIDDFTDADEIVNTEAVTTMVSLGVIDGNDDGSYNPTGVVKRGEMAKLIAVMLNGGKDPTLGATPVVFADTAGHWAQNYISYVANLHIIDGRGDGTFGPNDEVTGSEAAKMILTALGYRSDLEGFTGANWAINVQAMANSIDLFDGLTINPDEGLTRDDTAQMLYNAVQSWMVEYRNLEGSYDGIVYPQPLNHTKENSTVLIEKFKVTKVTGVVAATSLIALDNGATAVEGKTRLTGIVYNGEAEDANGNPWTDVTYPIAVDSKYLGYRVVIYVKGLNAMAPNASGMEVIGTYIISDDNTVVTTTGRLKDEKAVKDALKGSGIAMGNALPDTLTITEDDTSWAGANGVQLMPGVEQTFIDNDGDGTVDALIRKNPALAKVNTYNENGEEMNLSGIGAVDFVDIQNPEDVAQGDYVLVYNYDGTYILAVAESVSGVASTYTNNSSNPELSTITVDGTKYGRGSGKMLAPDLLDLGEVTPTLQAATISENLKEMLDNTYTLYLDPHGNILGYVEDDSVLGNYGVITGVNSTGHTQNFYSVEVKMILADGSTGKYDVNLAASAKRWSTTTDVTGTAAKEEAMYEVLTGDLNHNGTMGEAADAANAEDTLVTYSLDGSTITLGLAGKDTSSRYDTDRTANSLTLSNSTSRYTFNNGPVMTDDKTVFFIKDVDGNYTAVQGLKNLQATGLATVGTSQVITYNPTGSTVFAARALFSEVGVEYTSNSNYAFVTGNYDKTTSGTDTLYTYPVVLENGEVGTLTAKDDAGVGKNMVHEYQLDGDYVKFDVNTSLVVNKKIVTSVGTNAVSFADATNPDQGRVSYPSRNAKVWNVEDTKNVFETTLQVNDLVGLVLDKDGNMVTAFVYDRQDDDMVTNPNPVLSVTGIGTLDTGKGEWTGAASGNTLTMNLTVPADTTAKLKVEKTGTGSSAYSTEQTVASGALTLYTAGANENGGTIKVTLTLSDNNDKLLDRVITYTITVKNDSAPVSKVTVSNGSATGLTMGNLNGETFATTTNDTLKAGDNTLTTSGFNSGSTDHIAITIAATDGESATAELEVVSAPVGATSPVDGAYTSATDINFSNAGEYKLKLTVTTSKGALNNTITEYNLTVNVGLAAGTAPTMTVNHESTSISASPANTYTVSGMLAGEKITLKTSSDVSTTRNLKSLTVDASGATALSGTKVASGATFDLDSTDELDIYTAVAADGGKSGVIKVTAVYGDTAADDVTVTYTFNISCLASPAPLPTVSVVRFVEADSDGATVTAGAVSNGGTVAVTTAAEVGDIIYMSVTAQPGTSIVSVTPDTGKATWTDGALMITDASADFDVTITVSGDGYLNSTFTFTVDVAP